jgi:putative FmdB family regulatory protein
MPIYEYRCDDCGHGLERIQKMSDDPLKDCPACEKPALRRLISAVAFRLKGGGWYETDFKQGEKRNLADSGNDAKASSGDSQSKDSKPESTTSGSSESDKTSPAKKEPKKESKPAKETSSSTA